VLLPVGHVVIAARISDDGTKLLDGTISAVMPEYAANEALIEWNRVRYGCCWGEHCGDNLLLQVSDILLDGTQDPTRDCDAISVGIGFVATEVKLGPVIAGPPPPEPCVWDAGTDG